MKYVIISDVHGQYKALKQALIDAGVLNEEGKRYTDADNRCFTISIGDLANCAGDKEERDVKCLQKIGDWIDVLIMGNHEYGYFNQFACFNGFEFDQRVKDELKRIDAEGRLKPSYVAKDILISHAGWDKSLHPYINNAKDAHNYILDKLSREGWRSPIFSAVGKTRSNHNPREPKHGGILWEDFNDLRSPFPQIVGHTSRKRVRVKKNAICIDAGRTARPTIIEV